jgi:hypothetical protein
LLQDKGVTVFIILLMYWTDGLVLHHQNNDPKKQKCDPPHMVRKILAGKINKTPSDMEGHWFPKVYF